VDKFADAKVGVVPSRRYQVHFEVDAALGLAPEIPSLVATDHESGVEIRITNVKAPDGGLPSRINVQLFVSAESTHDARDRARALLFQYLDAASYTTSSSLAFARLVKVVDWTPSTEMRDFMLYAEHPKTPLEYGLDDALLGTSLAVAQRARGSSVERVLHWYRRGIIDRLAEDQFQYFWLAIETLASATKPSGRVPSYCQTCNEPLFCPKCNEVTTHRMFEIQAIENVLIFT
jgi:hypothetical protein